MQPETNFLSMAVSEKSQTFRKTQIFYILKTSFERLERSLTFQSHFTAKLFLLAILKNSRILWENPSIFWTKAQLFHCFEKSYLFTRNLQEICFIERFFEKINDFSQKFTIFFHQKTLILNVLGNLTNSVATSHKLFIVGRF